MNRRNRGLDHLFYNLEIKRFETDTKALPQYLEKVGLRAEIETWLDSLSRMKKAEHLKKFKQEYDNFFCDILYIHPVSAALLIHRFDLLEELQNRGCQMFCSNKQYGRKSPKKCDEKFLFKDIIIGVEPVDMFLILITNLKGLRPDDVRKLQTAVKRDFECKSEEQRELVCEDIVHAFSMSERNNIRFCWSRIKKYYPWLAEALLNKEYSFLPRYPFIKDWLEFNRNDQSRKECISVIIRKAGQWDIFDLAREYKDIDNIYEYDEYHNAVRFAEEYVQQDADNEAGLFSEFVKYIIVEDAIEERRKRCLYAAINRMSERHTDVLKELISKNAFRTKFASAPSDDDIGDSFDRDGTFRYLVGLLQGETIDIKYLDNADLSRYSEFPERFEYQQKIFRILPLNPGNRKRLYAFHKSLIRLDSEEVLTDAIGRGLFGRGNLRKAVEYAEDRKCCSVLPLLITEEYRTAGQYS